MTAFTAAELSYLQGDRRLARIATVGPDGTPHVTPVGWAYDAERDEFSIGGIDLAETKKFRDVSRTGRAALVIDEVLPPWRPRGIEVRGRADAVAGDRPMIRLKPDRIVSWGIESEDIGARHARTVA